MNDHSAMKLGRRDVGAARLAALPVFPDYARKLPSPPSAVPPPDHVAGWPMMSNDRFGCCVFATIGHLVQLWTTENGAPFVPSDADVLAMYQAATGFDPADPATDQGAVTIDALNHWRAAGIAGGHKLGAFARVRVGQTRAIKQAIWLLGGVCLGLEMPAAWQGAERWDVARGVDGVAGSWGGHSVPAVAYDGRGLTVVSWGKPILLTWAGMLKYCVEVQAPLSTDWADRDGTPGLHLDYATLAADLDALHGMRAVG